MVLELSDYASKIGFDFWSAKYVLDYLSLLFLSPQTDIPSRGLVIYYSFSKKYIETWIHDDADALESSAT